MDHFERLPDVVVLQIFNRVQDVKILGICCSISKRFNQLVPLVETVSVRVDCLVTGDENSPVDERGRALMDKVMRFVGNLIKPLQGAFQMLWRVSSNKTGPLEIAHHSPSDVLNKFTELRRLHIILPGAELGIEPGVLLKWYAEFDSTLETCVILGANSYHAFPLPGNDKNNQQRMHHACECSSSSSPSSSPASSSPDNRSDSLFGQTESNRSILRISGLAETKPTGSERYHRRTVSDSLSLRDRGICTTSSSRLNQVRSKPETTSDYSGMRARSQSKSTRDRERMERNENQNSCSHSHTHSYNPNPLHEVSTVSQSSNPPFSNSNRFPNLPSPNEIKSFQRYSFSEINTQSTASNGVETKYTQSSGENNRNHFPSPPPNQNVQNKESFTCKDLKLRIVWTISSLIAAAARHHLLKEIVCNHPFLESLQLRDVDGQGVLVMNSRQLKVFRSKPKDSNPSSSRTKIPDLGMNLWFASHLEVPGVTLEGATLVAIRKKGESIPPINSESVIQFLHSFNQPMRFAAENLIQRRTHFLEMNSF